MRDGLIQAVKLRLLTSSPAFSIEMVCFFSFPLKVSSEKYVLEYLP